MKLPVAAGIVTAVGLAWYVTGPPWYLSQTSTAITQQEEVVLIGLQAVAKGYLPYVGAASVQYESRHAGGCLLADEPRHVLLGGRLP